MYMIRQTDDSPIDSPATGTFIPQLRLAESSTVTGAFVPQLRPAEASPVKSDPSEPLMFPGIPLSIPASSRPPIPDFEVFVSDAATVTESSPNGVSEPLRPSESDPAVAATLLLDEPAPAPPASPAADTRVMELRKEPRFKTDLVARIEVIREKTYIFEGRVANVSALGFQVEMVEPLTVGETIRLTVDGFHMLAQVHHCVRSDAAFKIGVERVDQWDATVGEGAPMSPIMPRPLPVLGRPELKNPLGSRRPSAVRAFFAHPRFRGKQTKQQAVFILAGSVVLAASLAGFARWDFLVHRLPSAAVPKPKAEKALPVRPTTRMNAIQQTTDIANLSVPGTGTVPSAQQAKAVVPPISTNSAAGSAHSISIKASGASWVTACADGIMVFGKLFNKGDVGEVRFSRLATVRSGNAGALELAIGNQSIGPMGATGEIRTIKATPAGYDFVTTAPSPSCSIQ